MKPVIFSHAERLHAMLLTVLDQVDYTRGACTPTEMVGAVLPREVIDLARKVLDETKPKLRAKSGPTS